MADAEAIVAAAQASEAICAVGYQWHATELLDAVRDAVRGQSIGMLAGRNYGPVAARPWFMDRGEGGGQILERGSHHIDLQRAIAGEVAEVEATAGSVRLAQRGGGDIEDVLALLLHFEELGPNRFRLSGVAGGAVLEADHADPLERSIAGFLETVRTGDRSGVFCAPDDAMRTLAVALACERALADGGRLAV